MTSPLYILINTSDLIYNSFWKRLEKKFSNLLYIVCRNHVKSIFYRSHFSKIGRTGDSPDTEYLTEISVQAYFITDTSRMFQDGAVDRTQRWPLISLFVPVH